MGVQMLSMAVDCLSGEVSPATVSRTRWPGSMGARMGTA